MTKARIDKDGKLELLRGETWKYQDCPYIQYHPDVVAPSYYYCGDSCPMFEVVEKERFERRYGKCDQEGLPFEIASKVVKYSDVHLHCCGAEYELEVKE